MIARKCPVPRDAMLARYVAQQGCYTDCFEVMHPFEADLAAFVDAIYTSWLFRIERAVLGLALRRSIPDTELHDLVTGVTSTFAVWDTEARSDREILLRDTSGRTRSWLAVAPKDGGTTRLLFGSAIVPHAQQGLSGWVRLTLPLHRFYSRALLRLAERRLRAA